jgi:hypothetical protein
MGLILKETKENASRCARLSTGLPLTAPSLSFTAASTSDSASYHPLTRCLSPSRDDCDTVPRSVASAKKDRRPAARAAMCSASSSENPHLQSNRRAGGVVEPRSCHQLWLIRRAGQLLESGELLLRERDETLMTRRAQRAGRQRQKKPGMQRVPQPGLDRKSPPALHAT